MNTEKLRKILWVIAGILIIFTVARVLKNHSERPAETTTGIETQSNIETVSLETENTLPETSPAPTVKTSEATETEPASSSETETSTEEIPETTAPLPSETETHHPEPFVEEDKEYSDKEHVAMYIHWFNHLPPNYISKNKAESLGWVASKGNLWKVAPGKSIGGSHFGNYEGQLPKKKGRKYYECDIDFDGRYRNAKRIIYSNDGLIYYTEDHYETFELLYDQIRD